MKGVISMRRRLRLGQVCLILGLASVPAGCAGASGGRGNSSASSSPNVLTAEQIRETDAVALYDALLELRPIWLRGRGQSGPVVYIYGLRRGPVGTLYGIAANQVVRVEFMSGLDATTRYGTGHSGGVLLVDLTNF